MSTKYLFILLSFSFSAVTVSAQKQKKTAENSISEYYKKHKGDDQKSVSKGAVSNGSLEHAKLIPFEGDNYIYFDTTSYLNGRAFLNDAVLKITLNTYDRMKQIVPDRKFQIMECSNKTGGELWPHRTHQNGTSIDFMMPLKKNGKPYYDLDSKGSGHYWLSFDNSGKYSEDESVEIDFELVAAHILQLHEESSKHGWKVKKVIIKTELKDELFSTPSGKKLKNSGVYIVQKLTPMINALHDDHYHIDFAKK